MAPLVLLCVFALLGSSGGWTALIAAAMGVGGALLAIRPRGRLPVRRRSGHCDRDRAGHGAGRPPRRADPRGEPGRDGGGAGARAAALAARGRREHGGPRASARSRSSPPRSTAPGRIGVAALVASALASATVLVTAPSIAAAHGAPRPARATSHGSPGRHTPSRGHSPVRAGGSRRRSAPPCWWGWPWPPPFATPPLRLWRPQGRPRGSVLDGIGVAAVLFGLGVAAGLAIGRELPARLRLAPAAALALLPAAAAAGILVFAVQEGHLEWACRSPAGAGRRLAGRLPCRGRGDRGRTLRPHRDHRP